MKRLLGERIPWRTDSTNGNMRRRFSLVRRPKSFPAAAGSMTKNLPKEYLRVPRQRPRHPVRKFQDEAACGVIDPETTDPQALYASVEPRSNSALGFPQIQKARQGTSNTGRIFTAEGNRDCGLRQFLVCSELSSPTDFDQAACRGCAGIPHCCLIQSITRSIRTPLEPLTRTVSPGSSQQSRTVHNVSRLGQCAI